MVVLSRAHNHIYYNKSKHIRSRHNTIRDLLKNGSISISYINSKEYIDDPMIEVPSKERKLSSHQGE